MQPFTLYLRALDPGGEPPDDQAFAAVWEALRSSLRGELRRRGLWRSPPAWLGVHGVDGWDDDALEELTAEAYAFVFVDRLRSLRAQLAAHENVEGLVFLNLRHFLLERQRRHDPLGYRVFEVVQSAVRAAVAGGDLQVLAGDPGVRNETVLGARPAAAGSWTAADLRGRVAEWRGALLPGLITARGRRQDDVERELRGRLAQLSAEGAFRFKDLVDPIKAEARSWWAGLLRDVEGEPGGGFQEREDFARLSGCVSESLGGLDLDPRTRDYLASLWQFLRIQAGEPGAEEDRLSHRQLGERLGIPRERLPGLFAMLGRALERCRSGQSRQTSVIGRRHGA